jgi:hypothetical protein
VKGTHTSGKAHVSYGVHTTKRGRGGTWPRGGGGCAHRDVYGKGGYIWGVCIAKEGRKVQTGGMHSKGRHIQGHSW